MRASPAGLFASADEASTDESAKANASRPASRVDFLANRLVVLAPKASPLGAPPFEANAFAIVAPSRNSVAASILAYLKSPPGRAFLGAQGFVFIP